MDVLGRMAPGVYAFLKRNPIFIKPAKYIQDFISRVNTLLHRAFYAGGRPVAPCESCDDTGRWVREFSAGQSVLIPTIQYVHQSTESRRKVPGHLGDELFWKFSQNLEFSLPSTFVAQMPDARVLDDGFVITPDNRILNDVSVIINQRTSEHRAFQDGGVGPVHRVPGKVAVLASYAGRGYYHWMIDLLPRFELIRLSGYDLEQIDKFIVNCCLTSYQIETLSTLKISKDKLICIQSMKHLSVEWLVLPSLTNVYQSVPKWSCDFINEIFLDAKGCKFRGSSRIYVSRSIASRRHVVNESELVELLRFLGFAIVALEKMTVSEQALLFRSASVVVAPHGAGLTNLVFCEPFTKVLEIIHPRAINLMFWTISSHRNLDYNYLLAKGNLAGVDGEVCLNSDDMEVDLKALQMMLEKMRAV